MARGFMSELDTGADTEFRVDVREVGLHRARRDEEARGDLLVGQAFAEQPDDVAFGRGKDAHPLDGRLRSPRPRRAEAIASLGVSANPSS